MTTLDELLSPEPTSRELTLGTEFSHSPAWADSNRDMIAREYSSELASKRLALVRATLQEAAKLVCGHCAAGQPVTFQGQYQPTYYYHKTSEEHPDSGVQCKATEIHACLAKEKP